MESVVEKVGRFKGDEVPKILKAYDCHDMARFEPMPLCYIGEALVIRLHIEISSSINSL